MKQEVGFGGNPSAPVETQGAARDQTVQMEVIPQGLIPGMKNGQESNSAVQVSAAEIRERFGNRFKEDGDQDLWVRALVNKVVFEAVMPSRPRTGFETSH